MNDHKFIEEFATLLDVAPNQIVDNFKMAEGSAWDSLAFLSTMALIDTHFNKMVDPMILQSLTTFGELRALIHGVEV